MPGPVCGWPDSSLLLLLRSWPGGPSLPQSGFRSPLQLRSWSDSLFSGQLRSRSRPLPLPLPLSRSRSLPLPLPLSLSRSLSLSLSRSLSLSLSRSLSLSLSLFRSLSPSCGGARSDPVDSRRTCVAIPTGGVGGALDRGRPSESNTILVRLPELPPSAAAAVAGPAELDRGAVAAAAATMTGLTSSGS